MEAIEFHAKMKQHCDGINGDCRQCCFRDYCYSQARHIHTDFLQKVIECLLTPLDNDTDISCQVIRNPDNVFRPEENS